MNRYILLIYPISLLILVLAGARLSGRGKINPEYLSLEQSGMIRAAACLGVILHHLAQQVTGYGVFSIKAPITVLNYTGILCTALFFFYSGYGLIISCENKPGYLDTFLGRRLPAVLIPFWTVNLLGILLNRFGYGIHKSLTAYLSDLSGITLVNSNGWFIVEIVILYLAFYVCFKRIRNQNASLTLLCIFTVALIFFAFSRGHDVDGNKSHWLRGEWWFNSTGTFLFGLLYARFRQKADPLINRYYPFILSASLLLFGAAFWSAIYTVNHFGYSRSVNSYLGNKGEACTLLAQTAACILFTCVILLLQMRISLHSKILGRIDRISTELFLVHGYFVNRIFGNVRMNAALRFALVPGCSIAVAAVISPSVKWMVKQTQQRLSRTKPANNTLESKIAEQNRKKRLKILKTSVAAGLAVIFLISANQAAWRLVFARREYEKECGALNESSIGDEVYWGRFETDRSRIGKERLVWIVIKKEGDEICLLSKEGIAGSSYHQKHEAVNWENSDIRNKLNSEQFLRMFSKYETESLMDIDGDQITLLTTQEAKEAFSSDQDRELVITSAAEQDGTNINRLSKEHYWDMKGYRSSWWWLRGEPGIKKITAPIVTVDGTISLEEKTVNRPNGAIRPVIRVRIR